ncbi:MAG: response regulator [Lentisphaerae bacterium]|nr:response regulator [Lentisphaerota bacterium]
MQTKSSRHIRVLYIEDEPLARWTGSKIIESFTDSVSVADSCAGAEALWTVNPYELVVCDYRLPDGLAGELIGKMRALGRHEPVICLTGETEEISPPDQERLGIAVLLKKPMALDALLRAVEGLKIQRSDKPAAAAFSGTPAAGEESCAGETVCEIPLYVSPVWGLRVQRGRGPVLFDCVTGREDDVWGLLISPAEGLSEAPFDVRSVRLVFRQLARWMSPAATADQLMTRCATGLLRDLSLWKRAGLQILHLQARTASTAEAGEGVWRILFLNDGVWQELPPSNPVVLDQLIVLDEAACTALKRALSKEHVTPAETAAWLGISAETSSPGPERVKTEWAAGHGGGHSLHFWSREADRAMGPLTIAGDFQEGRLFQRLCQIESTLVSDGRDPFAARRLCCGLLDIIEQKAGPSLSLSWSSDGLQVTLASVSKDAAGIRSFFDGVEAEGETNLRLEIGWPTSPRPVEPWAIAAAAVGAGSGREETRGVFRVLPVPALLDEAAARALRERATNQAWLAVDLNAARYVSSRALAVLAEMASERRLFRHPRTGQRQEGRLCLTGFSSLLEAVLRFRKTERELDLLADIEALDSLGRRLTSMTERESLLESVVTESLP